MDVTSQEAPAPFCRWFNYMKSQGYEPTAGRVLTTPPRGPQRGAEVSSPDRGSGRGGGSPKTSQLRLVLGADGPHPAKLPLSFVALLTFTLALFCTLVLSRGRFGILLCNGSVFELLTLTLSPAPVTMRLISTSPRHQGVRHRLETSTCVVHSGWPLPGKSHSREAHSAAQAPSLPHGPPQRCGGCELTDRPCATRGSGWGAAHPRSHPGLCHTSAISLSPGFILLIDDFTKWVGASREQRSEVLNPELRQEIDC